MRRYFLGMAIASLCAACPIAAQAGDREIADSIVSTLKARQTDGSLKDFDLDLSVEAGVVTLTGSVANQAQAVAVVEASRATQGVVEIVNEISVRPAAEPVAVEADAVKPASGELLVSEQAEPPAMLDVSNGVTTADAKITDGVLQRLSQIKQQGALRNFELDVSTVRGEVWARGFVANGEQKQLVLSTIQQVAGVAKVVDDIAVNQVNSAGPIHQVSDQQVVSSMPMVATQPSAPRAFAPSQLANYQSGVVVDPTCPPGAAPMGGAPMGSPMPMSGGPSYGAGVPRYDNPQMPNYAWPSYAAYNNYAAVTYPKQYSASAWPYIGPFYPYPQVPLGWRKVALEWDDGLWYLDFSHKSVNY